MIPFTWRTKAEYNYIESAVRPFKKKKKAADEKKMWLQHFRHSSQQQLFCMVIGFCNGGKGSKMRKMCGQMDRIQNEHEKTHWEIESHKCSLSVWGRWQEKQSHRKRENIIVKHLHILRVCTRSNFNYFTIFTMIVYALWPERERRSNTQKNDEKKRAGWGFCLLRFLLR